MGLVSKKVAYHIPVLESVAQRPLPGEEQGLASSGGTLVRGLSCMELVLLSFLQGLPSFPLFLPFLPFFDTAQAIGIDSHSTAEIIEKA